MLGLDDIELALAHFEQLAAGNQLPRIKQLLQDRSTDIEDLEREITLQIADFLLLCLVPSPFESSMSALPEIIRERLQNARHLVRQEFRDIPSNPALYKWMQKSTERFGEGSSEESEGNPKQQFGMTLLKQNNGLSLLHDSSWKEINGKFWPFVRLAYVGGDDNISIVVVAHPADLLRQINSLLDVAIGEFERCVPLAERDLLEFPLPERAMESLDTMRAKLEHLGKTAASIGIDKFSLAPSPPGA